MALYTLHRMELNNVSIGKLYRDDDGEFICYILENPWKDNQRNISCIPEGVYQLRPTISNRFGECYFLESEKLDIGRYDGERTAILVHKGNYVDHTQGCLLPGMFCGVLDDNMAVLDSRAAFNLLMDEWDGFDHELRIVRL